MVQIKVVEYWIPYKRVSGRTCLSSSTVSLRDFKDWYVSNIIFYWNRKSDSVWCSMLPKIRIIGEKASNKNCWALNSVQSSIDRLWGEKDVCVPWLFFYGIQCSTTFIWSIILNITCILGGVALSSKVNLLSCFST